MFASDAPPRSAARMSAPTHNGNGFNGGGGPMAPPQNLEAEQSVLGAVLLSDTALPALIIDERLTPEDFYRESHGRIYQAMLDLNTLGRADRRAHDRRAPQAGRRPGVGRRRGRGRGARRARSRPSATSASTRGSSATTRCCAGSCTPPTRSRRRSTATRRSRATSSTSAERLILEVAHEDSRKDFRSIEQVLDFELDKLQKLSLEGTPITGTPSGFEDLDNITGGFQPGNLIILAARPSMGKSALMANFAENAALHSNKAVALFSLEMSEGELAQRFIASQASIKGDDLRKGRVPQARWGKILAASSRLAESKLYIDDSSDLSVLDVRAKAAGSPQQNAGRPRPGR